MLPSYVEHAVTKATQAAKEASSAYLKQYPHVYPCGFAWVEVYGVKGSTKLGKALIACGLHKNYGGGLRLSNAWSMSQSMGANEEGARAAAAVLTDLLGVRAYAASRID